MGKKAHRSAVGAETGSASATRKPAGAAAGGPASAGKQQAHGGVPPALAGRPRPPSNVRAPVPASAAAEEELQVEQNRRESLGCLDRVTADTGPQVVAATYWFDAAPAGEPYSVDIRFTGVRDDVRGKRTAQDRFDVVERVAGVLPGSGRIGVTSRVEGLNPGAWRVTAGPAARGGSSGVRLPRRTSAANSRFGVLAQGPKVSLLSWPVLVGLGAVLALVLQSVLSARWGMNFGVVLAVSAIGCLLGFVGGKVWYLVLHRKHPRELLASGACIQGFLLVALGVVVGGSLLAGYPVGTVLDATAPGIFLGMAVGRPGCFLTGCCAGRPTTSRWGLVSSDRRLIVRRFPVQLVEAAAALVIGVVSLVLVLAAQPSVHGAIFAGALAAYTFARQLLFPLRSDPHTATGRAVTMAVCGLVLIGAVAAQVLA
ncbi:phosphatidylglycerol:prolipoprotein diacylglycerol transferase [Amycolatopsis echigonensis]|uniref:Phosphatidylglycerol:prolipoprotein diacylglycerol transferase n=1 Tax=Amycolatopsis echigonensis TaxID=2576905 RepID=A0A2N3WL62_9PSEU|nr:phosphatidylglycerol:prolipoprotein diacylglycerol transferase [Amycolatopsis niigatensis]